MGVVVLVLEQSLAEAHGLGNGLLGDRPEKAVAQRHTETSPRDTQRNFNQRLLKNLSQVEFLCVSLCRVSVCLRATALGARHEEPWRSSCQLRPGATSGATHPAE